MKLFKCFCPEEGDRYGDFVTTIINDTLAHIVRFFIGQAVLGEKGFLQYLLNALL